MSTGEIGIIRADNPPARPGSLDLSAFFKVITSDRLPRKDEDINETIQASGGNWGGGNGCDYTVIDNGEQAWYEKNKGYSEKIGKTNV